MSNPTNLTELYSGEDLEILFKGGFINFGYWDEKTLQKEVLTETDTVKANEQLYNKVFQCLDLVSTDDVLEVGSGHGSGCAYLSKLFNVHSITGIDYFQKHVEISQKRNHQLVSNNIVKYVQGKAENMPFDNNSFDKIYTIEAFQHFHVSEAIAEFFRVLKKGGKLVIATFFAANKEKFPEILSLLPKPAILSDFGDEENAALPECLQTLKKTGFVDVKTMDISEQVWKGYDKWVSQNEPGIWDKNWLVAYQKKLLNYYIIIANK